MTPLQRFLEDELRLARGWMARVLADLSRAMGQPGNSPPGLVGLEVQRTLMNGERQVLDLWLQALRGLAVNATGGAGGRPGGDAGLTVGLALVDDDQAQEDVEVMRTVQLVEHTAEWSLRELRALGAALQGDDEIRPSSNPLRPELVARSLREAVQVLPLARQARVALLHLAAPLLAKALSDVYAASIERLEAQGVTPMAYRTARFTGPSTSRTGGVADRFAAKNQSNADAGFDISQPGAFDQLILNLPGAAPHPSPGSASGPNRSGGGNVLAAAMARQTRSKLAVLVDQFVAAGSAQARSATGSPVALLTERFDALNSAAATDAERNVLNLMTRLFERILGDKRLQVGVRAALARLQLPALRIALHDPDMLDNVSHATWRLLNGIAAQAIGYEQADDERLHEWLKSVHAALDQTDVAAPEAHHHAHAWRTLEARAATMLEAERAASADVITRLKDLERRDHLRKRHRDRIERQLEDTALTLDLRQFLLENWAEVLAACVMRYGDDSRQVLALQAVVPGLMRSLQPLSQGDDGITRTRENERLCQWIGKGLSLIGWPEPHQRALVARIAALQARAAKPVVDPASLTPEELVRRMREETAEEAMAPHDAGPASLIDIANLDTMPAPLAAEAAADPSTAWMRQLVPGLWCNAFVRARWRSLRLIWVSAEGGYLLFAGSPVGRHFSLTRPALDRLAAEGMVKPLEQRNTLERAVDLLMA